MKGKVEDIISEQVEEIATVKAATSPKKGKQVITLDTGAVVNIGASKDISGAEMVLVTEWNAGQAPHFSVPFGVLTELIKAEKIIPLGNYNGVPVVDSEEVLDAVKSAVETKFGIEWKAGKSGAVKAYKETAEAAVKMAMDMFKCDRTAALAKLKTFSTESKETKE